MGREDPGAGEIIEMETENDQKIRELAGQTKDTFVYFNNCHAGSAVQNARRMDELLDL